MTPYLNLLLSGCVFMRQSYLLERSQRSKLVSTRTGKFVGKSKGKGMATNFAHWAPSREFQQHSRRCCSPATLDMQVCIFRPCTQGSAEQWGKCEEAKSAQFSQQEKSSKNMPSRQHSNLSKFTGCIIFFAFLPRLFCFFFPFSGWGGFHRTVLELRSPFAWYLQHFGVWIVSTSMVSAAFWSLDLSLDWHL